MMTLFTAMNQVIIPVLWPRGRHVNLHAQEGEEAFEIPYAQSLYEAGDHFVAHTCSYCCGAMLCEYFQHKGAKY
jgi:hypothetical protein